MAEKVQDMNELLKINGSDNLKVSEENPATAHTRDRLAFI